MYLQQVSCKNNQISDVSPWAINIIQPRSFMVLSKVLNEARCSKCYGKQWKTVVTTMEAYASMSFICAWLFGYEWIMHTLALDDCTLALEGCFQFFNQ